MSHYTLELSKPGAKFRLVSKYTKTAAKAQSFKAECKSAAEALYKKHKKSGLVLFLENSFESLVLLETFLSIGAEFEVATLSCGRVTSAVTTRWKSRLDALKIKTHDVHFDFENSEHLLGIEALQKQFETTQVMSLFKMWVACHFDQFVVFSGDFCIPEIDSVNKISAPGLPGASALPFYNFSKSFDVEPFFVTSTHGLFKSQMESDFTSALIELHKTENRGFPEGYFAAKQVWYGQSGFTKLSKWPVSEELEQIWNSALQFESRNAHEFMSKIVNRSRQFMYDVKAEHIKGLAEPRKFSPKKQSMAALYRKLKSCSGDLINTGAIVPIDKNKSDGVYAIFPMLFTEHFFQGDLAPELEFVKQVPYYPNLKNLISANDLHLKPELQRLSRFFSDKVKRYFDTQGFHVTDFEITQCWANRSKATMDHHPHKHPNSIISGVFYFNDGDGDTLFSREVLEEVVIRPTATKPTPFNAHAFRIRPQFGKLVLFPSHIYHQVTEHQSEAEDRITLAFNVFIRGVIGDFNAGSWLDLRKRPPKK